MDHVHRFYFLDWREDRNRFNGALPMAGLTLTDKLRDAAPKTVREETNSWLIQPPDIYRPNIARIVDPGLTSQKS
jgi:hypothetical protein